LLSNPPCLSITNGELPENLLLRQSAADRSAKEVLFDSLLGDAGQIHSIGQTTLARNTKAQGAVLEAPNWDFWRFSSRSVLISERWRVGGTITSAAHRAGCRKVRAKVFRAALVS
jgi:hypothetical protein